jgi:hypothetical protein
MVDAVDIEPSRNLDASSRIDRENHWSEAALALLRSFSGAGRYAPASALRIPAPHDLALRTRFIDSLHQTGHAGKSPAQRLYGKIWRIHEAALAEFIRSCNGVGIRPTILKGAEFTKEFFDENPLGYMADADCLVAREEISTVKNVLFRLGYKQGRFDEEAWAFKELDVVQIANIEQVHYELAPFCRIVELDLDQEELAVAATIARRLIWIRDGQALFELMLDIHHAFAADITAEEVAIERCDSAFAGALTLSYTDHLWLNCAKYYTEVALHGKRTLREFAYLSAIMRTKKIRWEKVVDAADRFQIHASLYYYLVFAADLADIVLPDDVLWYLSPVRGARLRDWGWQLGPLFDSIDPMPHSRRSMIAPIQAIDAEAAYRHHK